MRKQSLCAAAGIPYSLTGEVSLAERSSTVRLWKLDGTGYELLTEASVGGRFEVDEPFAMSFDPVELLDL